MLGHVRVFALTSGSWCQHLGSLPLALQRVGWDAPNDVLRALEWKLVADASCPSAWNSTRHVALGTPLRLLPGQVAALYVHSAMNDDTGLQYTTCGKENTVARDDHLAIRAGISHTGNAPFSVHNRRTSSRAPWGGAGGWFRAGLQNLRVEIGS